MKKILFTTFLTISSIVLFSGCHHQPQYQSLNSNSVIDYSMSYEIIEEKETTVKTNVKNCDSCELDESVTTNIIKVPIPEKSKSVTVMRYKNGCSDCEFPVTIRKGMK